MTLRIEDYKDLNLIVKLCSEETVDSDIYDKEIIDGMLYYCITNFVSSRRRVNMKIDLEGFRLKLEDDKVKFYRMGNSNLVERTNSLYSKDYKNYIIDFLRKLIVYAKDYPKEKVDVLEKFLEYFSMDSYNIRFRTDNRFDVDIDNGKIECVRLRIPNNYTSSVMYMKNFMVEKYVMDGKEYTINEFFKELETDVLNIFKAEYLQPNRCESVEEFIQAMETFKNKKADYEKQLKSYAMLKTLITCNTDSVI